MCVREEAGLYPTSTLRGCSSLVSWYHNYSCKTLLKTMIMIEHIKAMQIPYLEIWSMLLSLGKVPHKEQFKSLVLEFQRPCAGLSTVLLVENNLPRITD